jgi:hypothetical protein
MNIGEKFAWTNLQNLGSKAYVCGYCGNPLASNVGYHGVSKSTNHSVNIYICHFCSRPTYFDPEGEQIPGSAYGSDIKEIDDKSVLQLYQEARNATSSSCYTAAVMCCRKLLMHLAVAKGAEVGKTFVHYVEYLSNNNYVPPDAKMWIDHIRVKGNEANHEIAIMGSDDAKELIDFCEMLLKIMYEFPAYVKKKYPSEDVSKE